jgi:hypothetical protein
MLDEHIRSKIQKLFTLADCGTGNEAETALRKAREIMAEYRVTEKDVKLHAIDIPAGKRKKKWQVFLIRSCAVFSGVCAFAKPKSFSVYGDETGVNVAAELFYYLKGEIERRTKESGMQGLRQRNSFRTGCVSAIYAKMEKMDGWRDMEDKAKKVLDNYSLNKKSYRYSKTVADPSFVYGVSAGSKINLNRQAGHSAASGFLTGGVIK